MPFIKTQCPNCNGHALKNTNVAPIIISCPVCGEMREDGRRCEEIVYSTAWWNKQGVKTQAQIIAEKQQELFS